MGSQSSFPRKMIGTDDGGEVGLRIKGTLPQRQLARALRRLREEAGLTLEEAAPQLEWSTSKLGRIETAQQGVDIHGVRSMLDLYNVGGAEWTELIDLTRQARKKNEWHAYGISDHGYLRLEIDAAVVRGRGAACPASPHRGAGRPAVSVFPGPAVLTWRACRAERLVHRAEVR
jgi:hypothetical protein